MFLKKYGSAVQVLNSMENGKCSGSCRKVWRRHLSNAVKSSKNPLRLTLSEKNNIKKRLKLLRYNNGLPTKVKKTLKGRPSPPFHANEYCGKKKRGNDGRMYLSRKNKNGICSWKPIL